MMNRYNAKVRYTKGGVAKIKRATYNSSTGFSKANDWWEIRAAVWRRDGGKCVPHKRRGQLVNGTDVHHIIPLTKGGTTTMANLMVVCDDCHQDRHTTHKLKGR